MIFSMKLFFSYLIRFEYLRNDPSYDIEMIKEQSGLPHTCMSEEEIKKLLEKPLLDASPLTLRDKAILEVLFSTAIRANELCSLEMGDIDYHGGLIRINTPKGGASFQRVVPIGEAAVKYLKIYLRDARPVLQRGDAKALFVSYSGRRLNNEGVLNVVKKYVFECGIKKHITTHSFRVTCATLMLKNGADIRYVQEQLGHRRITSTQKYTRLQPIDLKSIHRKCHPREKDMARERALEEKEAKNSKVS
jgi:integrase/recombinase XerD